MAAFEISITPPVKKESKKIKKTEEEFTPILILAPFNPTPEIIFGSIHVNAKITKPLIIYNPNPLPITVQLKNIDPEDRVTLSDSVIELQPKEQKEIHVSWSPIQTGYLRKVIRVQDASRKARSFDVVLNGNCINEKVNGNKRKRLADETNRAKFTSLSQKTFDSTLTSTNTTFNRPNDSVPLRRQTYRIEEKENFKPYEMKNPFRTSSPNHTTDSILENSLNIEAPAKYSNFESELRLNPNLSDLHSSGELTPFRRGTYTVKTEFHPKNLESLSFVDELDSIKIGTNDFFDSLMKNDCVSLNSSDPKNLTFEKELSPMKSLSSLKSAPEFADLLVTPKESTNYNLSDDSNASFSYSSKKSNMLFISPPNKTLKLKKSPDCIMPRRLVSSAISDRKKHLRTNILPKKKTPPTNKKNRMATMEKIKTQDPNSLKQVLKSHMGDPFLKQSLYCDENWIDRQEKDIIKWMNSLLTPPVELNDENNRSVDAVEVWLKSRREHKLRAVPSVDNVATAVYHTPQRLDTLRKVALSLVASEPVCTVFKKINLAIEKKIISVREDRDLHIDQGLRNKIMQLLSCYNPLWLQISLEAVYNQKITRQGKADVNGLGWFIRKHLLTSSTGNKKNAHPAVLQIKKPSYKDQMKKYILEKFLCLIYFLDQAKMKKLIRYNPCLFVITSEFKSSQDLLLAFCGDLVVGRGDIVKHLKSINYILHYKQTCIDEYDYTINSLHDLKDGVRLSRLFEILFSESDICSKLRVPAISLLQKIYNVSVAMKIAQDKCKIEGDITAKEIVSGNREKMLSFLWQIINNYLTPLYSKSALKIQKWWRSKLITLRLKNFVNNKKEQSAIIIQTAWKRYSMNKKSRSVYQKQIWAAIVIQRRFRTLKAKNRKLLDAYVRKSASVIIQNWWRCVIQRKKFLDFKSMVVCVQRRYRAIKAMKSARNSFLEVKKQTILIQRKFKANLTMRSERNYFLKLKYSAIVVQRRFRANCKMRKDRDVFLKLRVGIIFIQRKIREKQTLMRLEKSAITLQRYFRAKRKADIQRQTFNELKLATITIQRRFKANQLMKIKRGEFFKTKNAAVFIQQKFRAQLFMKSERTKFLMLKNYVITIQRKFRSNKLMKLKRNQYLLQKKSVILIQRQFRANLLMKREKEHFVKLKAACITILRRFRANKLMKIDHQKYIELKKSTVRIQTKFRAYQKMKFERNRYLELRKAVILCQQKFRTNKEMKNERESFLEFKKIVIMIQQKFRAKIVMKTERSKFLALKAKVVLIQTMFRANKLMKIERQKYLHIRKCIIRVQQRYRAILAMKKERSNFIRLRNFTILIQNVYRAKKQMLKDRQFFLRLKSTVTYIQTHFRCNRLAKVERSKFLKLKNSCIVVQKRFRNLKAVEQQRKQFLIQRNAALVIQNRYRDYLKMQKIRNAYLKLKYVVKVIQCQFRLSREMKNISKNISDVQNLFGLCIESFQFKWTRSPEILKQKINDLDIMCKTRLEFIQIKMYAVFMQRLFRKKLQLREKLKNLKKFYSPKDLAAIKIQALWRGYQIRKNYKKSTKTQQSNTNVNTQVTLGERYKKAILQLKTNDMYDVITKALWNLESVTMLSAKLCEGVVAEGIIPIILNLMSRGNRSEPFLEIYRTGCSILVNLARYTTTKIILWESINKVDDIYLILHIMRITHDKLHVPVFCHVATLLWLLCQDRKAAKMVAELYSVRQQIEKMLDVLKRKCLKNPKLKLNLRMLPKKEADWYPKPNDRIFENNYVAILNVHRLLFSR